MGFAIAGAALAGSVYSGYEASQAAASAASSQAAQSQAYQDYVSGQTNKALDTIGVGYTPAQMSAYDDALAKQEASVQRQEQLAQSLSPALISAGKQMNQILQGQAAPVLQNLQNQRSLQRQQMLDQLNQQMGPGAATSTAGQQALQRFDAETSNMMSNAQQSYLGQVSGIVQQGNSLESALGQGNAMLSNIQSMDPQARGNALRAQIMQGGLSASAPAQQAMINAAGASAVPGMIQAQTLGGAFKSLGDFGAAYYGNRSVAQPTAPAQPSGYGYGSLGSSFMNGGRTYGGPDQPMTGMQTSYGNQTVVA